MTYQEALDYLYSLLNLEKLPAPSPAHFNLQRMESLLNLLNNPHQNLKAIHIAGTKGKGSTAAMLSSVLTTSGKTTGLYTSPHLFCLRERIKVNGKPIGEEELAELVEIIKPILEKETCDVGLRTFFEALTSLAFLYFQRRKVDLAVIEAGLGGRLDATNVIHPQVAVITSISLDHTEILGNSLSQIAWEKAGVIKPGVIAVIAPQAPEAAKVIRNVCAERGVMVIEVGRDVWWEAAEEGLRGQAIKIYGLRGNYHFFLPLAGEFQQENAATAVAALEALEEPISPQDIALGMSSVYWPGRFQLIRERPTVIADGAHNPYSVRRLRESVNKLTTYRRLILVMGSSKDKDIPGMVEELVPLNPLVIATSSKHPKAAPAEVIADYWKRKGIHSIVVPETSAAFKLALELAAEEDLILITGSLFLVAEAIEAAYNSWGRLISPS